MTRRIIHTKNAPQAIGTYSQAARVEIECILHLD